MGDPDVVDKRILVGRPIFQDDAQCCGDGGGDGCVTFVFLGAQA